MLGVNTGNFTVKTPATENLIRGHSIPSNIPYANINFDRDAEGSLLGYIRLLNLGCNLHPIKH